MGMSSTGREMFALMVDQAVGLYHQKEAKCFVRINVEKCSQPIGGSCVQKSLPLKTSPITRVLQVARRIKREKTEAQ